MAKYRNIGGRHYGSFSDVPLGKGAATFVNHGDVIETEAALDELFPNKFEKIPELEMGHEVSNERKRAVDRLIRSGTWTEDDRKVLEFMSDEGFKKFVLDQEPAEQVEAITSEPPTQNLPAADTVPAPKKRGRPKKEQVVEEEADIEEVG